MDIVALASDALVLLFSSIFLGQLLGRLNYKGFKLGSAGSLFAGFILSYFSIHFLMIDGANGLDPNQEIIPSQLFQLSLTGFIASVGLLASKKLTGEIKKNGYKFILLALTTTGAGAMTNFILNKLLSSLPRSSVIGTYPGALTSSPTLATALELAKELGTKEEVLVGLGYTIAYIPAVMIVVVFVQILGKRHKPAASHISTHQNQCSPLTPNSFNVISFAIICLLGNLVGKIELNLGTHLGSFSLGATGGVLLCALVLGNVKGIGFLNFHMDNDQMAVVRDISLNIFLATVGLNYGYSAVNLIKDSGVQLLIVGVATTCVSIEVGFLVGRKLLKLSMVNLIGGICGSMTSTPGLSAAMESLDSDDVVIGYGGAYPFGLFFKIVFINLLFRL